jgi:hypothetical protein
LFVVLAGDVLDVAQPVVNQAVLGVLQRGLHPAAVVVPADDHVPDPEHVHGELQHGKAVEVRVHHDVGDVAVHEQLARHQPDDLVGRHAAVGAADPQVLGRLLPGEPREEVGVARRGALGPHPVVLEKMS